MPITAHAPIADDLYQLRDELVIQTASTANLVFDARNLGTVNIVRGRGFARLKAGDFFITPNAGYSEIRTHQEGVQIPFDKETDFGLRFEWPRADDTIDTAVGVNMRDGDDAVIHAQANWAHSFGTQLRTTASIWINEVVDDTSLIRVLGTKDKVAVGGVYQPTQWDNLRLTVDGHRYRTREGATLADGYRLEAVAEHTLLRHAPLWTIRLQGSWEENALADSLPLSVAQTYFTIPDPRLSNIISPEFGTFGGGTTLRLGAAEGLTRQPFLVADVWIGMLWPSHTFAYYATLGVGVSFFRRDKLSANLFHANTQGGQANNAYEGIGITYNYLF